MLHESLLASVPNSRAASDDDVQPVHAVRVRLRCRRGRGAAAGRLRPIQALNDRAFKLAERGRNYCWRGLEVKFRGISQALKADPARALARAKKEHVELLYWSAASLGAAISAGGLDHPELLIDWPVVRALAERALALDETWSNGAIPELMITVESQGEALGGSEERARRYFARAVEIQRGLSPGPYVALATGVVKSKQDRDEFAKLSTRRSRSIPKRIRAIALSR